jgi:hypothetical protein
LPAGQCFRNRPEAAPPRPQRQIGVLAVHEEAQVEAAELRPERAGDEQQAARNDSDLADRVALPAAERLRVEHAIALERGRQHRREAEHAPERRLAPARAETELAVRPESPAAVEAVLRTAAREPDQVGDGSLVHHGVGVEEEQVLAASLLGRSVDARREAEVLVEREQPDLRELAADHLRGAVAGSVVEDDHLEVDAFGTVVDRRETLPRRLAALVGDDDDGDVRSHEACSAGSTCSRTA